MDGNIAANGKFWNVREINIKKLCYSPQQQQQKKHFAILYIEKCLSAEILVQSRERRRLLCGIYGNKLCVHEKSLRVELC